MRLHTRINISPSGLSPEVALTLGNLWATRVICQLAEGSGGTATMQWDDRLVYNTSIAYRNDRWPYCEAQLQQMGHYGLSPSSVEALEAQGIPGRYQLLRESECVEATELAWRQLGWRERFGDWPPPYPDGSHGSPDASCYRGERSFPPDCPGGQGAVMSHPYVVTSRVVMDALAGRNCIFNGDDCREGRYLYHLIAVLLNLPVPAQFTIPLLRYNPGEVKISTSEDPNPFFVRWAIEADVTAAQLWGYLEAVAMKPGQGFRCRDSLDMTDHLRPWPVIEKAHWARFLKASSRKRQALIGEVRAR